MPARDVPPQIAFRDLPLHQELRLDESHRVSLCCKTISTMQFSWLLQIHRFTIPATFLSQMRTTTNCESMDGEIFISSKLQRMTAFWMLKNAQLVTSSAQSYSDLTTAIASCIVPAGWC